MLALNAIGGMGKTALSWYWMQEDVIKGGLSPHGIIWWSFYDKESSFENFLNRAISYVTGGRIDHNVLQSTREKMSVLHGILYNNEYLLVLDGVDKVLRTYYNLSSPYQGDEIKEDERDEYRSFIDPNLGDFIRILASGYPQTKTLLTSRLHPKELDDLDGCVKMDLTELNKEDAVCFFKRQGVIGTRAEIEEVCRVYGFHPLSLRLLSSMIVHDLEYQGNISYAKYILLVKNESKIQGLLSNTYNNLSSIHKTLLLGLPSVPEPITIEKLCQIFNIKNKTIVEEIMEDFQIYNLINYDTKTKTFSLHPIVKSSILAIEESNRLKEENIYEFDIALSFAGEDREIAQKLAYLLRKRGIKVFYDEFERSGLWGKNLYEYFKDIYQNRSKYCIPLLSRHYEKKIWTRFELRAAQSRALKENDEYILPIRIDDTEITGILPTVGYLDLKSISLETAAKLAVEKLEGLQGRKGEDISLQNSDLNRITKKRH
jgi:hypothetical protein